MRGLNRICGGAGGLLQPPADEEIWGSGSGGWEGGTVHFIQAVRKLRFQLNLSVGVGWGGV